MGKRESGHEYHITTEGETEGWYLEWLQGKINEKKETGRIKILHQRVQNPKDLYGQVKRMSIIGKTEVWHWMDTEGEEEENISRFQNMLDAMRNKKDLGKDVEFRLGYSALSFETWMLMHKVDRPGTVNKVDQYLPQINRAFSTQFESLQDYKSEKNFKKILEKLDLSDVCRAIERAEKLEKEWEDKKKRPVEYKKYTYRLDNPSTSVWRCVKMILQDNGLLEAKVEGKAEGA